MVRVGVLVGVRVGVLVGVRVDVAVFGGAVAVRVGVDVAPGVGVTIVPQALIVRLYEGQRVLGVASYTTTTNVAPAGTLYE